MRTLVIVFALLVASCAGDSIWWELPPDMTDAERAAFGEGLELVNFAARRQQYIAEPGEGNRRVFLRRPEHMVNGVDANGEVSRGFGVMNLARHQPTKQLVMVVAHEAFHELGVEHHTGRGVMNKNGLTLEHPDDPLEITEDDRAACRNAGACP